MDNMDYWQKYDVGAQYPDAKGFLSSAFDGRYLYFVPFERSGVKHGVVARYDTKASFGDRMAWSTFDIPTKLKNEAAKGFFGGAFDGRYIYFVPHNNGAYHGTIARYDTTAPFEADTSWQTYDITSRNPKAAGFVTAVFDGRYLYLSPYANPTGLSGTAARYDTKAAFTADDSWTTFDIAAKKHGPAAGFLGSTFDGRYVYFAPNGGYSAAVHGNVVRYDTRSAGFTAPEAWEVFDVASSHAGAVGFQGATFDGRYVYLLQYHTGDPVLQAGGVVARYDTQAEFQNGGSWTTFNSQSTHGDARGYSGSTFDGRNIYMVPSWGHFAFQYDTQSAFTATTSWKPFSLTNFVSRHISYRGAGFDGEYVYFVPMAAVVPPVPPATETTFPPEGTIVRFRAKSPAWLPRNWNSAFD